MVRLGVCSGYELGESSKFAIYDSVRMGVKAATYKYLSAVDLLAHPVLDISPWRYSAVLLDNMSLPPFAVMLNEEDT